MDLLILNKLAWCKFIPANYELMVRNEYYLFFKSNEIMRFLIIYSVWQVLMS